MSRHERGFALRRACPEGCENGQLFCGVLGPNDPDVVLVDCPTCGGAGDVEADEVDEDDINDD